jgi:ABC-type Fe3+-siderophore transport system permease subunit
MRLTLEKSYPYTLGLLVGVGFAIVFVRLPLPHSAREAFSSCIDLGAIGVGFLSAVMTFLLSMQGSPTIDELKRGQEYRLLIRYLLEAIVASFVLAVLSFAAIFASDLIRAQSARWIGMSFWAATLGTAAFTGLRASHLIYRLLQLHSGPPPRPTRQVPPDKDYPSSSASSDPLG